MQERDGFVENPKKERARAAQVLGISRVKKYNRIQRTGYNNSIKYYYYV